MLGAGTNLNDRYMLADRLGGGGMGEVWRADDTVLGRAVVPDRALDGARYYLGERPGKSRQRKQRGTDDGRQAIGAHFPSPILVVLRARPVYAHLHGRESDST